MTSKPIWKTPQFCISMREAQTPPEILHPWMRRKPCCDCGETVVYDPLPIVWELLRPYLVICNVCATARKLEAGDRDWTFDVEPRPRDP